MLKGNGKHMQRRSFEFAYSFYYYFFTVNG